MTERDPTSGELKIMFQSILTGLAEVKETMATKEFVNAKFDGYNDRVSRLERDQKEWTQVSTAAHVELDKDSKARHAQTEADLEALDTKIHTRIDKVKLELETKVKAVVDEQKADQKEIKNVRNGRVTSWIGIGIAWLGTVAMFFIQQGSAP